MALPGLQTMKPGESSMLVTRHSAREWRGVNRILLAEDNAINQQLAIRILEKHVYAIVVANNGREAVNALEREAFDLVLMDVQMPEMDGLEATAAIRKNEKMTGSHVPIIAMTAHAMKGDREKCLNAGMDGYLTKPIQLATFLKEIDQHIPHPESSAVTKVPGVKPEFSTGASPDSEVFDPAAALRYVEGDEELLSDLVRIFASETPILLQTIHQAYASQDYKKLERALHTLSGSAGSIAASNISRAAKFLEGKVREGQGASSEDGIAGLDKEFEKLTPHFETFLRGVLK